MDVGGVTIAVKCVIHVARVESRILLNEDICIVLTRDVYAYCMCALWANLYMLIYMLYICTIGIHVQCVITYNTNMHVHTHSIYISAYMCMNATRICMKSLTNSTFLCKLCCVLTHTCTHTHAHLHTHTQTHPHTYTHIHTCTHTHA